MNRYNTLPLDITTDYKGNTHWIAFTTRSPGIWKTGENEAQAAGRLVLALASPVTPLPRQKSVFERVVELAKTLRRDAEAKRKVK